MPAKLTHVELVAALRGEYSAARRVLHEVMAREDRDELLAAALDGGIPFPQDCSVVGALGDVTGEAGIPALKRVFEATGRGTASPRGLAALAIAKRAGASESAWLRDALAQTQVEVRGYVMISLAGAADDSAWEDVFALLPKIAKRVGRSTPPDLGLAIAYLGRHVANPARRLRLVETIRALWPKLHEDDHTWLRQHWPEVEPGRTEAAEVPAPNAGALQEWIRARFFRSQWGPPGSGIGPAW